MEKHIVITKEEAIQKIQEMSDDTLFVLTFDFDDGIGVSGTGEYINRGGGERIIGEAKTRIFSGNEYMSQLNLYNVFQKDIKNIEPKGVMKTILLRGLGKDLHYLT